MARRPAWLGFDELPLPQALLDTLDSATHVADVVTAPVMTPLLTFAAARGCRVQTGPEMALAQMTLMGQFIGAIPPAQERQHEELGCDRHRQRRRLALPPRSPPAAKGCRC